MMGGVKMRRLALIISLAMALCLAWCLPVLARSAQKPSSMHSQATRVRTEDPSAVYGWAVVKDPRTRKRWTPETYPSVKIIFVKRSNGRKEWVNIGDGSVAKLERRYNTWRYYIKFQHDTTYNGRPWPGDTRDSIKYNPLDYRFSHLEVYFRKSERQGSSTRTIWQVDCSRQSRPFRDLPDMPEPTRR
jgi:hypothetical protein